MDPREELELLRKKKRLAELELRAGANPPEAAPPPEQSTWDAVKQGAGDLAQGAKASLDRTALGLKGLLPQGIQDLGDAADRAMGSGGLTQATATKAPDTAMGTVGDVGGEIAQAMIPGGAALKAAGAVRKGLALTRAARVAPALAIGTDIAGNAAASAAMAPEDRGTAAMMGAGGTLVGQGAGRILGGALRRSVSPEAQTLVDRGIYITPGQAVSGADAGLPARILRSTEEKATSLPIVGDVLKEGQRRSFKEFNLDRINDALGSIGKVKQTGLSGIEEASNLISKSYDDVLPHISIDPLKADAALQASKNLTTTIPHFDQIHQNKLDTYIDRFLTPLTQSGKTIDGATAKRIDSELGQQARDFSNRGGLGNEPLGEAFFQLRDRWRHVMEGATPEARQVLSDADKAYAKLLPIEQASAKTSAGDFTPKQLADSLRKLGMADDPVVQAARQVLPQTVPDSGTAGRQLLGQLLSPGNITGTGAAAAGLAGFGAPALAAAGAAATYTKPGVKMLTQGVHPMIAALRKRLSTGPYDPNQVEDIIRNLVGRSTTAGLTPE